jgi:hypothetical protein
MWEPVGPLPAAVYWRRRCVALASALTVVGVVVATAGAPAVTTVHTANSATVTATPPVRPPDPTTPAIEASPDDDGTAAATSDGLDTATVGTTPTGTPAPGSTRPGPGGSTPAGPTTARSTAAGAAALDPTSSGTPAAGSFSAASVPGGSERIHPDDTPRPTVAVPPSVPVPASGPVPCTNAMLSAAAEIDHPVHRVGSHPVLRLVITNVSGRPCVRDLDSARQEIVVWSEDGRVRLWSSNDCVNASTIDLRTLVPGRPVAFAVTWGERTTTPGCRTPRTVVPAGSYRLMVRLDDLISPPTPFIRTP